MAEPGRSPPPPTTNPLRAALRRIAINVAIMVVVLVGVFMLLEDSFIYFPTKGGVGVSPGEDVWATTRDGVKLHGWLVTHPKARATLLWLHGNAANIENRRGLLLELRDALAANVLIIDYRGYGRSEGRPSEQGLYLDARAAWDWLAARVPPGRIVVFGKSLGGGPACDLASQVDCGGLILQSTFTRAPDMASRVLPFFPSFLVRTRFDNLAKVARIRCPKLFVHSRADEIIPFEMGERLFAAAAEPKESAWFDGAGHNELWDVHPAKYHAALRAFVERVAR